MIKGRQAGAGAGARKGACQQHGRRTPHHLDASPASTLPSSTLPAAQVRALLRDQYSIDRTSFNTWFKNRRKKASRVGARAKARAATAGSDSNSDSAVAMRQMDGAGAVAAAAERGGVGAGAGMAGQGAAAAGPRPHKRRALADGGRSGDGAAAAALGPAAAVHGAAPGRFWPPLDQLPGGGYGPPGAAPLGAYGLPPHAAGTGAYPRAGERPYPHFRPPPHAPHPHIGSGTFRGPPPHSCMQPYGGGDAWAALGHSGRAPAASLSHAQGTSQGTSVSGNSVGEFQEPGSHGGDSDNEHGDRGYGGAPRQPPTARRPSARQLTVPPVIPSIVHKPGYADYPGHGMDPAYNKRHAPLPHFPPNTPFAPPGHFPLQPLMMQLPGGSSMPFPPPSGWFPHFGGAGEGAGQLAARAGKSRRKGKSSRGLETGKLAGAGSERDRHSKGAAHPETRHFMPPHPHLRPLQETAWQDLGERHPPLAPPGSAPYPHPHPHPHPSLREGRLVPPHHAAGMPSPTAGGYGSYYAALPRFSAASQGAPRSLPPGGPYNGVYSPSLQGGGSSGSGSASGSGGSSHSNDSDLDSESPSGEERHAAGQHRGQWVPAGQHWGPPPHAPGVQPEHDPFPPPSWHQAPRRRKGRAEDYASHPACLPHFNGHHHLQDHPPDIERDRSPPPLLPPHPCPMQPHHPHTYPGYYAPPPHPHMPAWFPPGQGAPLMLTQRPSSQGSVPRPSGPGRPQVPEGSIGSSSLSGSDGPEGDSGESGLEDGGEVGGGAQPTGLGGRDFHTVHTRAAGHAVHGAPGSYPLPHMPGLHPGVAAAAGRPSEGYGQLPYSHPHSQYFAA